MRVLRLVKGCNEHGHGPAGIRMEMHEFRALAEEMLPKWSPGCFKVHADLTEPCESVGCETYRRMMMAKPGDEGNMLWGVPLTLVADVPSIEVIHDAAVAHAS